MSSIVNFLTAGAQKFLRFLFAHFYTLLKELWEAKSDIQPRYLASDFLSVLRSAGMFAFLNLVAFIVFAFLPQGKDVLLIIAEDISRSHRVGNLLWLIIGVVFWSIASEYGSRYSIYVTDNTALSISDKRVVWRKAVQKSMAEFFLMLPYLIVSLGFLINYLQDTSLKGNEKNLGFGIPALCLYLVFRAIARFYYNEEARAQWRQNPNRFQRFMLLSPIEQEWCNKLFGIYNRYIFTLRKPSNFTPAIKGNYQLFCNNFLEQQQEVYLPEENKTNFPQDPAMLDKKILVPASFTLDEFTDDGESGINNNEAGQYKWTYSIPLNFYYTLHRQLRVLVLVSLLLFVTFCFLPVSGYANIGAPGLITIAFGCWCGIYAGLLYMDYAALRASKISLRFILLLLLIFSSWFNDDHPVRYNSNGAGQDKRPRLEQHFTRWMAQYEKDSTSTLYMLRNNPAVEPFFPVVFVCAEGGALRTGAFAAQTLSFLQDSIQKQYGIDVKRSVYAFSGVSGGSVGISFFNAAAYLSNPADLKQNTSYSELTKSFFKQDYLAPVIGKMFYADLLQLFLPVYISRFDRAVALERAWEGGFEKVIQKNSRNIFSADYNSLYNDSLQVYPAMFINTTETESGLQCWLSNIKMDKTAAFFADKRDLLSYKIRGGINYSTMINFSSRFPLFSPAATLIQDEGKKFHYADGGYVENTGCGTMLEVLQSLKPIIDRLTDSTRKIDTTNQLAPRSRPLTIKPFVLVLKYNESNNDPPVNINFGNEISEIIYSMYNTRSGRSTTALYELTRYTRDVLKGEVFVLPLQKTGSEVPMNWVLSDRSLEKIEDDIKTKWAQRNIQELRGFFAIDTNYLMRKNWPTPAVATDSIHPKVL